VFKHKVKIRSVHWSILQLIHSHLVSVDMASLLVREFIMLSRTKEVGDHCTLHTWSQLSVIHAQLLDNVDSSVRYFDWMVGETFYLPCFFIGQSEDQLDGVFLSKSRWLN
jgi:hypothetical protein